MKFFIESPAPVEVVEILKTSLLGHAFPLHLGRSGLHITLIPPIEVDHERDIPIEGLVRFCSDISPISARFTELREHQEGQLPSRVISLNVSSSGLELLRTQLIDNMRDLIVFADIYPLHLTLAKKLDPEAAQVALVNAQAALKLPIETKLDEVAVFLSGDSGSRVWRSVRLKGL